MRPRQWLGMALAFSGVAAGVYRPADGSSLLGDLLAIASAAAWGATTILIKTLLYQIVISALVCPLVAYVAGERWPAHVSLLAAASLAHQSIWVVGVTYLVWFWLLRVYRAAELSAFTFVTPVVGVLAGWLALGERMTLAFLAALALVAAGIVLVHWPAKG